MPENQYRLSVLVEKSDDVFRNDDDIYMEVAELGMKLGELAKKIKRYQRYQITLCQKFHRHNALIYRSYHNYIGDKLLEMKQSYNKMEQQYAVAIKSVVEWPTSQVTLDDVTDGQTEGSAV